MKKLLMTLILLLSLQLGAQNNVMEQTIYQFKVEDIEGNIFDFNTLQGKKIMIVNTASSNRTKNRSR
jgi:glutathione peroxidase